jgi:hypothetical protein
MQFPEDPFFSLFYFYAKSAPPSLAAQILLGLVFIKPD